LSLATVRAMCGPKFWPAWTPYTTRATPAVARTSHKLCAVLRLEAPTLLRPISRGGLRARPLRCRWHCPGVRPGFVDRVFQHAGLRHAVRYRGRGRADEEPTPTGAVRAVVLIDYRSDSDWKEGAAWVTIPYQVADAHSAKHAAELAQEI